MDRKYYLASGEDERKVREFFKRRSDVFNEIDALGKEVGGVPVADNRNLRGFVFDEVPAGWREAGSTRDSKRYCVPVRRSKEGKAMHERIRAIRIPDASSIHALFSDDGGVWGEMRTSGGFPIYYITAEIVRDQVIIHVPEKMDFVPEHSRPLKDSEYWQVKEAAQEAAQ